jgi:hypothetical protein
LKKNKLVPDLIVKNIKTLDGHRGDMIKKDLKYESLNRNQS